MSWLPWLQSLITFRKSSGNDLVVPRLDDDGRIRILLENAGPLVKMFQGIDTVGLLQVTNASKVIQFNYESIKDDYYVHSTTIDPGEVTIQADGWYKITASITVRTFGSGGGTRGNPQMHIEIDSGLGFVQQPDNMGGYVREDSANSLSTSITGVGVFQFSSGDKIRITVKDSVISEPDEETVPYSQRLLLEYIDRTGASSGVVNNLKDIGDVNASAPSNNDVIIFDSATSKWVSGATPSGESNTASNVGTGVDIFKQKVGVDLEFRGVNAASPKTSAVVNGDNIDIDVAPGNIPHQDLNGVGTNTHTQIDSHISSSSNPHSVTKAQVGLSDVTNDAALKRSANDLSTFTDKATLLDNDIAIIEDSADSFNKKKATVAAIRGTASIFGQNHQEDSSDGESTTTSGTFQQKLRMTTGALSSGTYRIGWFYEWGKTALTDVAVQVQINDTITCCSPLEESVDAGSDQYFARGGHYYYTASGVLNIDLDYRANGTGTARIRRARLEIWRVS